MMGKSISHRISEAKLPHREMVPQKTKFSA